MQKYTVSKHIRVTEEEALDWARKAKLTGFKESCIIRALMNGYEPKEKPGLEFFEAMGCVTRLADEIRELRNTIRSCGNADTPELDKEIRRWQKLRQELELKYLAPDPGFMLLHKLPKNLQIKYSGQLNK